MTEQDTTLPDLSVKATSQLLSCSPKHIWVMIQEGALRSYKIGRISRVARESIELSLPETESVTQFLLKAESQNNFLEGDG